EIDKNVAAEDQIEHAKMGEVRQQIELPVSDHGAKLRREPPHIARPREIPDQEMDRQSALHLEVAVDPCRAFSRTSLERSVATRSMRQPASSRSISLRMMASEYGSWPVAAAAHQMRMV